MHKVNTDAAVGPLEYQLLEGRKKIRLTFKGVLIGRERKIKWQEVCACYRRLAVAYLLFVRMPFINPASPFI